MKLRHLRTDGARLVHSPLTGHALWVSDDTERAFALPILEPEKAAEVVASIRSYPIVKAIARKQRWGERALSNDETLRLIDELLARMRRNRCEAGLKREVIIALFRFVQAGLLSLTPKDTRHFFVLTDAEHVHETGPWQAWLERLVDAAVPKNGECRRRLFTLLLRLACASVGVREMGDLTLSTISPAVRAKVKREMRGFPQCIDIAQRERYGAEKVALVEPWRPVKGEMAHWDTSFADIVEKHADLGAWAQAWSEYVGRVQAKAGALVAARCFLRYLAADATLPRDPEAYCRVGVTHAHAFHDAVHELEGGAAFVNAAHRFFEDFLDHCVRVEANGQQFRRLDLCNPIPRLPRSRPAMTTRDALPQRYIEDLVALLTENDFAFPRSLGMDQFSWLNPRTGQYERHWSPVRTVVLLVKLYMPWRTFQVRMLESDEADPVQRVGTQWVKQERALHRKPRGWLQQLPDGVGGPGILGFFVNTNKTKRKGRSPARDGYFVPWQHDVLIDVLGRLQAWQKTYNPATKPTRWADIRDSGLQRQGKAALEKLGQGTFLFRDPCTSWPDQPISDHKVKHLWALALMELERRLAARGERTSDDHPIELVVKRTGYRDDWGRWQTRYTPKFDLHSLRVAGITRLVTEGKVDPAVVAQCVAGHHSVVQTLYYTKLDAAAVNDQLRASEAVVADGAHENFEAFREEQRRRAAQPALAVTDGLSQALQARLPAGWLVRPTGLCPVNASRCQRVEANSEAGVSAEPEAHPCARCPFHVSGPAFLPALIAQSNRWSDAQSRCARDLARTDETIRSLEEQLQTMKVGTQMKRLEEAHRARSVQAAQLDAAHRQWVATLFLTERCRQAAVTPGRLTLVSVGNQDELQAALDAQASSEKLAAFLSHVQWLVRDRRPPELTPRGELVAALEGGRTVPLAEPLTEHEAMVAGEQLGRLFAPLPLRPALPSARHSPEASPQLTQPLLVWARGASTVASLSPRPLNHRPKKPGRWIGLSSPAKDCHEPPASA